MSRARWPRLTRLVEGFRHAFALAGPHGLLTEADYELLRRLAAAVVRRRMAAPALLFLQSLQPLSYIGSQAMIFLRPFLTPLLNPRDYQRVADILERREGLEELVKAIERAAGEKEHTIRNP